MKTIVALSDTHGNKGAIKRLLPIICENDYLFHLGDGAFDTLDFDEEVKDKLYVVRGNNDAYFEKEAVVEIENRKVLLTHGDLYRVRNGIDGLIKRAKELGCDTVFYGHTHSAIIEEKDGVTVINPGALSYTTVNKTYCYAVVSKDKITAKIVELL